MRIEKLVCLLKNSHPCELGDAQCCEAMDIDLKFIFSDMGAVGGEKTCTPSVMFQRAKNVAIAVSPPANSDPRVAERPYHFLQR